MMAQIMACFIILDQHEDEPKAMGFHQAVSG